MVPEAVLPQKEALLNHAVLFVRYKGMMRIVRILLLLSIRGVSGMGMVIVGLPPVGKAECLDDYHWDATVGACLLYPPPPPCPPDVYEVL